MEKCKYCNKECKSKNSLKNHECRCNKNPTRIKNNGGWNKGLTKETDQRVLKNTLSLKKCYDEGRRVCSFKGKPGTFKGKHHTEEAKQKIREAAIANDLGGWNYNSQIDYNGIHLDSSYELLVAKTLDENNVKWSRPEKLFYKDNMNKSHYYFPDFYLPEYDVYLDPKNDYLINNINKNFGYSDLQKIKWVEEQNNVRIIVLDKNNLNWSNIKTKIV